MGDIKNEKLLYLKGALFVALGCLGAVNILLLLPSWQVALSLLVVIWAFSRAYYFAFYVVEHYIDEDYRFASLWQFFGYVRNRSKRA